MSKMIQLNVRSDKKTTLIVLISRNLTPPKISDSLRHRLRNPAYVAGDVVFDRKMSSGLLRISVFFKLFAAAEPSAYVCVAHGTPCGDTSYNRIKL